MDDRGRVCRWIHAPPHLRRGVFGKDRSRRSREEDALLRGLTEFWQQHDPTTENRQGNDIGTQYRSAIFWTDPAQERVVRSSLNAYQEALTAADRGTISTVVAPLSEAGAGTYYYAEPEHQQYLAKNPAGYCNHGFNGVACSLEGAV